MKGGRNLIALAIAILLFTGCTSTTNEEAPLSDEGHPAGYLTLHGEDALADVVSCKTCHGRDYTGGTVGINCFDCHISGPPFSAHPLGWSNVNVDHRNFALEFSWTTCSTAGCHGLDLKGGAFDGTPTGPSCFTATGCHDTANNGPPPPATHTLNYSAPADHGPAAKQNQFYCRNCHGLPPNIFDGGFVTPNYNGEGDCSSCHIYAKAHPTDWQGDNDTNANGYMSTHRMLNPMAIDTSCALCHGVDSASQPSPMLGAPSCFSAQFENSNSMGVVPCHAGGPPGHDIDSFAWAGNCNDCHSDNGMGIVVGVHNDCLICHVSDSDRARKAGVNGNATLADSLADPNTATCLTCHDPVLFPTAAYHHLLPDFITRDCVNCHGINVAHNVTFNSVSDLSGGTPCSNPGCHDGEVENWTNIMTRHDMYNGNGALVCDSCHKSLAQTSRTGIFNENRTIEDVIFTAMDTGATVNCLECHLDRQDAHSGHDATVFSFGADGCATAGCHDAARYGTLGTPEVVNDVHGGTCTTCHTTAAGGLGTAKLGDAASGVDGDARLAANPFNPAATCLTCHPATTYPGTVVHHDRAEYLTGNCTFCHAGGAPGHSAAFAASSGGCEACHSDQLNVVVEIHGGQCTLCHASATGSADNEIFGAHSDGDATRADGTAAAGTWSSVTCLTCHVAPGVNAIPDIHHDNTSSGEGPTQAVAGNCTWCHADPRPALNTANALGSPTAMTVTALSCRKCHTDGAGNIYLNSYNPTSPTNADGGTIATNFATVQQTLMDGNGGTVDHSFASTIQSFGACLCCHLANVTTIYGTSGVKVNVFHARPQDWFKDGNDTDDTGADDQTEVLRGGPGRETFRMFGDGSNPLTYWPLGDLRGQGLELCGDPDKTYKNCTNNEDRWRNQGLDGQQGNWDNPVAGYTLRMDIPCGNWNDDGTRPYCDGTNNVSQSVPHF